MSILLKTGVSTALCENNKLKHDTPQPRQPMKELITVQTLLSNFQCGAKHNHSEKKLNMRRKVNLHFQIPHSP